MTNNRPLVHLWASQWEVALGSCSGSCYCCTCARVCKQWTCGGFKVSQLLLNIDFYFFLPGISWELKPNKTRCFQLASVTLKFYYSWAFLNGQLWEFVQASALPVVVWELRLSVGEHFGGQMVSAHVSTQPHRRTTTRPLFYAYFCWMHSEVDVLKCFLHRYTVGRQNSTPCPPRGSIRIFCPASDHSKSHFEKTGLNIILET